MFVFIYKVHDGVHLSVLCLLHSMHYHAPWCYELTYRVVTTKWAKTPGRDEVKSGIHMYKIGGDERDIENKFNIEYHLNINMF